MKFNVNSSAFTQALSAVIGAVEKRTTIPVLGGVFVEAKGGKLALTATDLELSIRTIVEADVKIEGSAVVPAKKLLDYVKLVSVDVLSFSLSDNNWLSIAAGKSKTRMACVGDVSSFPEIPVFDVSVPFLRLDSMALGKAIDRCIFAISSEESRFTLNGALLEVADGFAKMVATDSHRLALCEVPCEGEGKFLMPRRLLAEIQKKLGFEGDLLIYQDNNNVFMRAGVFDMVGRKMTGNFPDYKRVIPGGLKNSITLSKSELKPALDRCMRFSDERAKAVLFTFGNDRSTVQSDSMVDTGGDCTEELSATFDGDYKLKLNAGYFLEYLRVVDGDEIALSFNDSTGVQRLEDSMTGSIHILMPMRA
jgi:DNA polymerase-3 subunit beta